MAGEKPAAPRRRRVLFVCVGNSCRSQFAEAFARKIAADVIDPASAGLSPFGRITETTIRVGREFGLCFDGQFSKPIRPEDLARADLVINMTGIDSGGLFETPRPVINWDVPDPFGDTIEVYRRIAADIEARIVLLAAELRASRSETP